MASRVKAKLFLLSTDTLKTTIWTQTTLRVKAGSCRSTASHLLWVIRVSLTQLLSSAKTETKLTTSTVDTIFTICLLQAEIFAISKYTDEWIYLLIVLPLKVYELNRVVSYWESCLLRTPIISLWERHANCGRLLSLFYIWGQDVAFLWRHWMRTSCRHQYVLLECVCVCVCVPHQVFVGKTWPQFLTSKPPHIFFFLPPLLPHYVLFTPLEATRLPLSSLLFHRPTLTWLQYVSLHPTAVFIIPAFACSPFRDSLFCLERQKKTVMSKTPPTSNPDGSQRFHMHQRDATHTRLRDIQLHKTVRYENIIILL